MENKVNLRLYYDEDETREDEDAIRNELFNQILPLSFVEIVEVHHVYTAKPYEAIVTVEFPDVVEGDSLTENSVCQKIILACDFLHNADTVDAKHL